jgi:hypothetical protein
VPPAGATPKQQEPWSAQVSGRPEAEVGW